MKHVEKLLVLTGVLVAALMTSCASPPGTSSGESAKAQSAESAKPQSQSTALLPAQTKPQGREIGQSPESILWVGNSFFYYNDSMHSHFGRLVSSVGPNSRVRGTSVTISGSGLDWHDMDSLLRPNGLGRYSFVGDNEIRFNKPGRQYDTAIMMDCSQCPVHPQLQGVFHETVRKYSQSLVRNGVRPVLFMSWAYKDKPEMTAQLAEQYTLAGNANDALVIPAGLAFAKAIAKRPDIELYQADKRHPSTAGIKRMGGGTPS